MGRVLGALLLFCVLTTVMPAQEEKNRLRWNGFVSVGGGMTLGEGETFLADPQTVETYGDRASYRADTHFGLQAQIDLGEGLSAAAQLVGRGGNDFDMEFEWAYLNYVVDERWSASAGRLRVPLYFYSDFLDVAYTYHWIRPPLEVYSEALTSYDGATLRFSTSFGPLDTRVEAYGGRSNAPATPALVQWTVPLEMDLKNLIGSTVSVGFEEWLQFRATYMYSSIDFSFNGTMVEEDNDVRFYGTSVHVDRENWFVVYEFTHVHIENRFDDRDSWYISGGVRIGDFTPHVTYSELREQGGSSAMQQVAFTAGLRYDFHKQAAVKLEFVTVQEQSSTPMFGDSDAIALAVDVVF